MLNLDVNDESSPRTSSTQSSTVRSQVQCVELGKAMLDAKIGERSLQLWVSEAKNTHCAQSQ